MSRRRVWIFPRDPDFAAKAAVALDLYARVFEGKPLGPRRVRDLRRREDQSSRPAAVAIRPCRPGGPG